MLSSKTKLRTAVRQAISTHNIRNGDIVLLRRGTPLANEVSLKSMGSALARQGYPRCVLAVVDRFDDLTILNETQMNELGWQRIPDHSVWKDVENV